MEITGKFQGIEIRESQLSMSAWIRQQVDEEQKEMTNETKNIQYFVNDEFPSTKYLDFVAWCKKEGVHMPKIKFPEYFEDGLMGLGAKEDIEHREVFLYVPYKMIMSVKKAMNHEVLGPIILDHPECFNEEHSTDWEQLILGLYLLYELTIGKKSYWYPFLRVLPEFHFISSWEEHEIEMMQNEEFDTKLVDHKALQDFDIDTFSNVISQYPNIFPAKFQNMELYESIYTTICTRCFGEGVQSTSLIPMAEMLNHNNVDVTCELINTKLHMQLPSVENYHRFSKSLNQYDPKLFKPETPEQEKLVLGRFSREEYEKNQLGLSYDTIRQNLKEGRQIWEVVYNLNKYEEYSDSEEEEEEQIQSLKLNAISQLMVDEYKLLRNKTRILDMGKGINEDTFREQITLKVDTVLQGNTYSSRMRSSLINKSVRSYKKQLHLEINNWMLDNLEYVPMDQEGPVKDKEQNWVQKFKDDESDEEFQWVESNEAHTYIAFVNGNRKPIKKGEQVYYNYGRRSNQFLLIDYGFCFQNNQCDSYEFMMNLNIKKENPNYPDIIDMIARKSQKKQVQKIRLKLDQINEVLLCYIRNTLTYAFCIQNNAEELEDVMDSIITNLKLEAVCLQKYQEIVEHLHQQLEEKTSLEQDLQLLDDKDLKLTIRQKFAVIYRSERKKILRSQLDMIRYLRKVLSESSDTENFQKIYLQPMEHESLLDDTFIYRRLCLRDYLLQIYNLQTGGGSSKTSFGDKSFWDERYSNQKQQTFDWLGDWSDFKENIEQLVDKQSKILNLGCGNSTICQEMYDEGYQNIWNMDISEKCIDQMKQKRPEMKWEVMDARDLSSYDSEMFDMIIDKSTIDALLCGKFAQMNVAIMLKECQRVLKTGGSYVAISYGDPDTREYIFKRVSLNHLEFTTHRVERINKEKKVRVHYIYIGKKIKQPEENWSSTVESIKQEMQQEELQELEKHLSDPEGDQILKKQIK